MAGRGLAGPPRRPALPPPRPRASAAAAAAKRGKGFGGAPSMADALARIGKLEAENRALRDELRASGGKGGGGELVVEARAPAALAPAAVEPVVVAAKAVVEAVVAPAVVAPPAPTRPPPPVPPLADLEGGIVWPAPGEKFWERPARSSPLVLEGKYKGGKGRGMQNQALFEAWKIMRRPTHSHFIFFPLQPPPAPRTPLPPPL